MADLRIRDFSEADFAAALALVHKAWSFSEWVPGISANHLSDYFLSEMLSESNFIRTAEFGGEFAGLIAARDLRTDFSRKFIASRRDTAYAALMNSTGGRGVFLQFLQTEELDKELLTEAGESFSAELTLLVVREDIQGHGIGGALMREFARWLKQIGVSRYCLFTDSACDFGYYERAGLKRLARKTYYWSDTTGESDALFPEEYYLYAGNV